MPFAAGVLPNVSIETLQYFTHLELEMFFFWFSERFRKRSWINANSHSLHQIVNDMQIKKTLYQSIYPVIRETVLTLIVAIVDGLSSTLGIDTSQHFTYIQLLKLFPLSYLARAFKNAPNAENIL